MTTTRTRVRSRGATSRTVLASTVLGWLLPVAVVVVLIVLWQLVARLGGFSTLILPAPTDVLRATEEFSSELTSGTWTTLYETAVGFAVAVVSAVPLAVLVVEWPILRRAFYPVLLLLQAVPKVAMAPVLIVWMGFGEGPKVVIAALSCFFPVFLDTVAGLQSTPREHLDLFRTLRASRLKTLRKLRFPHALPHIFVGMKVGITFAVIGAVVAEFVQANEGLGYIILVSSTQAHTDLAFAAMIILAFISIVLFYIVDGLERLLIPWAEHQRGREQ